jgi:hypothetical protein
MLLAAGVLPAHLTLLFVMARKKASANPTVSILQARLSDTLDQMLMDFTSLDLPAARASLFRAMDAKRDLYELLDKQQNVGE